MPEVAWIMAVMFSLSPGVQLKAIALGFHNYGIVGRLVAEVMENMDFGSARVGNLQMVAYGTLGRQWLLLALPLGGG